jgi:Uma2 family endonuclease
MIALKDESYISPEQYLDLELTSPVKHEYIDGEIFAMAGSSDSHAALVRNAVFVLFSHLRGSDCQVYPQDIKAKIPKSRRYYYPDVIVTCDDRDKLDRYVKHHYKLIVEVLSDSTESFDRGLKFQDYRRAESLQEYVLISQDRMNVEVYRRKDAGRWELQAYAMGEDVEFVSVGVTCAIGDLYEDVVLPPEEPEPEEQ